METRKITVFSTQGKQKAEYELPENQVWSDLKTIIKNDYSLESLMATENINRTDLVNDQAKLPAGNFTIFLRPIKTKSGAYSYKEARAKLTDEDKTVLFKTYNKNWTQATTEQLNEVLNREKAVKSEKTSTKVEKPEVEEVVEVVSSATEPCISDSDFISSLKADLKESVETIYEIFILKGIEEDYANNIEKLKEVSEKINNLLILPVKKDFKKVVAKDSVNAEKAAKLEKEKKDKKEKEALDKEWLELQKGF